MATSTRTVSEEIRQLHEVYCQQSQLDVQCTLDRLMAWETFIHRGFTREDLVLVCRNLSRQVKDGRRGIACLGFRRLIVDLENFEELLAQFKALQRRKQFNPGKAQVLRDTGRPDQPKTNEAVQAEPVIESLKFAQKLRRFREENL